MMRGDVHLFPMVEAVIPIEQHTIMEDFDRVEPEIQVYIN